jgi:6-phosphofructokinase 2
MQRLIATLTLNPTIDGSSETEAIKPFVKIRTSNERYSAGGGGINVVRTILALGGQATAIYLAGGATGALLHDLLARAEVSSRCVPIAGETRIAHTVFERSSGAEYRFVPEGPTVSTEEWSRCVALIVQEPWDYLIVSGSHAPGVPDDAYGILARVAKERGARLILDSSGAGLRSGLEAGVHLVKPSLGELEEYAQRTLADEARQVEVAAELIRRGKTKVVALTMGNKGALLVTESGHWTLKPPSVEARSAVGAGDSFVGAITLSLARGLPVEEAFAWGVAAGTAAVLASGHEPIRKDDVARLFRAITTGTPLAHPIPVASVTA